MLPGIRIVTVGGLSAVEWQPIVYPWYWGKMMKLSIAVRNPFELSVRRTLKVGSLGSVVGMFKLSLSKFSWPTTELRFDTFHPRMVPMTLHVHVVWPKRQKSVHDKPSTGLTVESAPAQRDTYVGTSCNSRSEHVHVECNHFIETYYFIPYVCITYCLCRYFHWKDSNGKTVGLMQSRSYTSRACSWSTIWLSLDRFSTHTMLLMESPKF